jgi:hypothetical protein
MVARILEGRLDPFFTFSDRSFWQAYGRKGWQASGDIYLNFHYVGVDTYDRTAIDSGKHILKNKYGLLYYTLVNTQQLRINHFS